MCKNVPLVNIPVKSEFDRDIEQLKKRRRKDDICKHSLIFVAVIGVIGIGFMMVG